MGRVYLQSIRLAFALVCLGASLILASHWFGLLPDVPKIESDARRRVSEAVAINAASHVRKQQWLDLRTSVQTLVDRDESLLSVGVRNQRGYLKAEAGHHDQLWQQVASGGTGVDAINVPITLNRRPWGTVELCFVAPEKGTLGAIAEHPLLRLLAFFCITGMVGYTLFVGKVMRVFSNTQVVPERVRQALDTLAEGLLVLDENARIILANRSFAQTVDVPGELLVESHANDLPWIIADPNSDAGYPWMSAINDSATVTEQILHLEVEAGKTRIFSVNAAPIGGAGSRRGALATFRDVTHVEEHRAELERMLWMLRESRDEIEKKNRELEVLATQDALTGCLNRRAFFDRFGRLWTQAVQEEFPLACIMIDNDHFKRVNDSYGHAVGDEVLRRVARLLRDHHQGHGFVCRYGGEEFCVLLPRITYEQAIELAEQTRAAIEEIVFDDPAELRLTASIGVSETRFGAIDPQDLINQADICLYAAKRNGRNCVIPYTTDLADADPEDAGDETDHPQAEIPFAAVQALLASLAFRDAWTANHSARVAQLCRRVAQDCPQRVDEDLIEIAALLHEIGKVGVSDELLLKREALQPEESRTLRDYERVGAEFLHAGFECPPLTDMVRLMNARFDATDGNPNARHGKSLPVGARILAICDCYDSLVHPPAGRPALSHQQAIGKLLRSAGSRFDPELVNHFVDVIDQKPEDNDVRRANEVAIGIGVQVERLLAAIEDQDTEGIRTLSARLVLYARRGDAESIARSAERIHQQAIAEEVAWFDVIRETTELMQQCRDMACHAPN